MRITHVLKAVAPFALAAILSGCATDGASAEATTASDASRANFASDTAPLTTEEATLVVRGLSCPKCANNVNLALARLPGVDETHIDMGSGEVRVEFDAVTKQRPSKAQLARAITDAGFTIVDIRTN